MPALDRRDPLLEFLLDLGGVDAEGGEHAVCRRALVGSQAEQQVLGAELGLAAPGRQAPGTGHGLVGFAVTDDAAFLAVSAGDHRGLDKLELSSSPARGQTLHWLASLTRE